MSIEVIEQPDTETGTLRRLRLLLAFLFGMVLSVEGITHLLHDHRRVTLEIEAGLRQALSIRPRENYRQVLFAGNSLVFEDLDQSALQRALGPGFLVYKAGVPGSTYSDWRFGLRALIARGSRPDVIVFGISPSQFLRAPQVTPVPVSVLWSTRDIFEYARDQHLGLTKVSELVLEHYSVYFSLRDTVRIYMRKFIPGYEAMLDSWARNSSAKAVAPGPGTEAAYLSQLSQLAASCGNRTRLVIMIAPTNQLADRTTEPYLRKAAADLGIPVVEPVTEEQWPVSAFKDDGYHLTPASANVFSALVANGLKRTLEESGSHGQAIASETPPGSGK
jgi:hypothetical protein